MDIGQRIKRAARRRGVSMWWSNENRGRGNRVKGSMFRAGRFFLSAYRDEDTGERIFGGHVEWTLGKLRSIGATVAFEGRGGEDQALIGLHLPYANVWLGVSDGLPKWLLPREARELSLSYWVMDGGLTNGHLSLRLWCDPDAYGTWRYRSCFPRTVLLGRDTYTTRDISTERTPIPLPEGAVMGTVRLFESTWKHPRWPWPRRLVRAEVTPDRGAVVPGKGENSWDQDDDAILSLTTQAETVPQAVAAYVESVLETRRRHGGRNWMPPTESTEAAS